MTEIKTHMSNQTDTQDGSIGSVAQVINFNNFGVVQTKIPFDLYCFLEKSINEINKQDGQYNHLLLGHLQEEYSLNHIKGDIAEYILAVADAWRNANPGYVETFEEAAKTKSYEMYLDSLWVNKQKKYEFNPPHNHAGVLSFVIWMKIPYNLTDEENYFPPTSAEINGDRTKAATSKFCFYYTNTLGDIVPTPIPVDKNWEGTMMIFPSKLKHGVYPFYTSDDYRISISGNIRIQNEIKK
jgi:hypothetical protein